MIPNKLTLDTLGGGVACEKFQRELTAVLENILDPNTEPDDAREITLKVKFKPSEDREHMKITVTCDSKLAGAKAHGSIAHIGRVDNEPVAINHDPRQLGMFEQPAPPAILNIAPTGKEQ